jgi:uncharacterized protein YkwD
MGAGADRGDGTLVSTSSRLAHLAATVVLAAGLLTGFAAAAPRSQRRMPSLTRHVLVAVNAFRRARHLVPLRASAQLTRAARQHTSEMGRLGYFAHSSANGIAFWRRIERYYGSRNYSYWSVGENLLWAAPSVTAGRALKMWIASPEHLRNLLAPQWRQIGVSAIHVSDAGGVFGGRPVTIITTDFGARH